MRDKPRTPPETLQAARQIALRQGIRYAYTGNVDDVVNQSPYCPDSLKLVIERNWYDLRVYHPQSLERCHPPNKKQ